MTESANKNQIGIKQRLKQLFENLGYLPIRVNKFEDYDLYIENKNFLSTSDIITFMDMDGKLRALKPDVTLSVVKNIPEKALKTFEKVYYTDEVYRLSKANHEYKVVQQIGVELMGPCDEFSNLETITLAIKSLEKIDPNYQLDISHIGFLSGLLESIHLSVKHQREIMDAIHLKSMNDIQWILKKTQVKEEDKESILKVAGLSGNFAEVLPQLQQLVRNDKMMEAYQELHNLGENLVSLGISGKVQLDFSVIGDLEYYNGLAFLGYVEKVPKEVLSGGRYDNLMKKMGKDNGAIGFAVYLSELKPYEETKKLYDVDICVGYTKNTNFVNLFKTVDKWIKEGKTVRVEPAEIFEQDRGLRYEKGYILENNQLKEAGYHA